MKFQIISTILLIIIILNSCGNFNENNQGLNGRDPSTTNEIALIPINYDFDNLRLYLNSSIDDTLCNIEWRWDHMNSDNGVPDSMGIDYYMNISQPVFSFNQEATLPSLSAKTYKNKIIEFSVTVIFHLPNKEKNSISSLMNSLTTFDLFKQDLVRKAIIEKGKFQKSSDLFEEEIVLKLGEDEYDYDRITYKIKAKARPKGK